MSLPYNSKLIPRAKEMRRDMTKQERRLWYDFLNSYSVRFQRQKTIDNYIVDFYCHAAKLVLEIDGGQHCTEEAVCYDTIRSDVLNSFELLVVRFTNNDIDGKFDVVCGKIDECVKNRLPPSATLPPPSVREAKPKKASLLEGGAP